MSDDDSITSWGLSIASMVVALIALLMLAGQCGIQERDNGARRTEIEHLEERLDVHLRDHGK